MTLEEMITGYIQLRDKKEAIAKQQAAVIKQYKDAMDLIGAQLKAHLQSNNLQNIATDGGTAFLKTVRSATVADKQAFREHVIANGEFDLADFRPNKEAVEDWANDPTHGGNPPPGVKLEAFLDVGVQRK